MGLKSGVYGRWSNCFEILYSNYSFTNLATCLGFNVLLECLWLTTPTFDHCVEDFLLIFSNSLIHCILNEYKITDPGDWHTPPDQNTSSLIFFPQKYYSFSPDPNFQNKTEFWRDTKAQWTKLLFFGGMYHSQMRTWNFRTVKKSPNLETWEGWWVIKMDKILKTTKKGLV